MDLAHSYITAANTFADREILRPRSDPWSPERPFPSWRSVVSARSERETDRQRRARHFMRAYAFRCGGEAA